MGSLILPASGQVYFDTVALIYTVEKHPQYAPLHAATAKLNGCTLFITNDAGFKRIPELTTMVLDDLLTV